MIKIKNKKREKLIKFCIYSIIYALFIGVLYGTAKTYYGIVPIQFGLYMSWDYFFIMVGLLGWALIMYITLKKELI